VNDRTYTVDTGTKSFATPFFFPSISSVKTNLTIIEYLDLMDTIEYSSFLISAYDLFHMAPKEKNAALNCLLRLNAISLLDSGHYEAYWYHDSTWKFEDFEAVLSEIEVDFAFTFDIHWDSKTKIDNYIKKSITTTARTAGSQRIGNTIPLIHSTSIKLPKVVTKMIEGISPEIIAVAERELGDDLIERAQTIKKIRNAIKSTGRNVLIHVLGTGNPRSILLYSLCGADIYDGLEWCQTTVDPSTGTLHHFSHKNLIECSCKACKLKDLPYSTRTLTHNLLFYEDYMNEIRDTIIDGNEEKLIKKYYPKEMVKKVLNVAGL
jgi:queuine/archaeosine tRNA-ribosyltransferase